MRKSSTQSLPKGKGTFWPEDESQPCIPVYSHGPQKRAYAEEWFSLWQSPSDIGVSMTEQAKMERPLTQTEYRVRDWIIGTIGLDNFVHVNQSEVARELRVQRADVSRAIKRLIELEILIQGPKFGRSNSYKVHPAFCFRGSLDRAVASRREAIKNRKAKIHEFKNE